MSKKRQKFQDMGTGHRVMVVFLLAAIIGLGILAVSLWISFISAVVL